MARQLRLFLVAIQFYTRIPVTGRLARWMGWDSAWLGPATRYFPLAGILVAFGQAVVYIAASLVVPQPVAVLFGVLAGLLLTGAFHEDGWADFCDGFGGGGDRASTLAIMRDSRIGAYGAIGLVVMLMLRFETLAHLEAGWMVAALVCSAAFSRGCVALVLGSLPYARDETDAKAKPIAGRVSAGDVLCAVLFATAPSIALATWTGDATPVLMASSFALGAAALMRRMIRRRLGGYTGDCLGAVQQVAELAFLLGLLIVLGATPDVLPAEEPEEEE